MTRRLAIERRLGSALALATAAYLLLPTQLLGGSAADHRLLAALFPLLVAASRPQFPSPRAALAVGVAVATMLAARMTVIEWVWRTSDGVYAGMLEGLDRLPRGARLAVAHPQGAVNFISIPTVHLATLAIIRRDAFVPTLFAGAGQQPVVLRPPYNAAAAAAPPELLWAGLTGGDAAARRGAMRALADYDYVAFTDRLEVHIAADACLAPVFSQPLFQIFALRCTGS